MNNETKSFSYSSALIWIAAILTCIGLVAIYSASSMKGSVQFNDPYLFLRKQGAVAIFGFAIVFFVRFLPLSLLDRIALPLVFLVTCMLSLILIPGVFVKVGGAFRWINIAGIQFQPSELAKIALVFFLAKNLSRSSSNVSVLGTNLYSNIAVSVLFGFFMMLQPDFGTTALLAGVTFFMLYAAGLSRKLIVTSFFIGILGFIAAVLAAPYRMKRLLVFIDPWADVSAGGFQIIQSYMGFQNGGLLGVGLGESKQKLFFLPEAHTDFILAVIGEELGLFGVLLICFLYFFLSWIGFQIANRQPTAFRKFLAYGFTCLISLQSAFNMGVVMGMLPTKGIPLPFISSGASSLIVSLIIIAILSRLGQEVTIQNEVQVS